MTSVAPDLSENVSKLVELTKQLAEAKSDIKIIVQEEKRLKDTVKQAYDWSGYRYHQSQEGED